MALAVASFFLYSIILPALYDSYDNVTVYWNPRCHFSPIKAKAIAQSALLYKNVTIDDLTISLCSENYTGQIAVVNNLYWEAAIVIQAFDQACVRLKQLPGACYNNKDIQTILNIFVRTH